MSETKYTESQKLDSIIEHIFKYYEFQNVFELEEGQSQKAYQLFLDTTKNYDLEKEITHDILVKLIVTSKLRININTVHAIDDIQNAKQVAPECATALAILSAILSKVALKDVEIEDIEQYEPYHGELLLDEEMGEFYEVDHNNNGMKLKSSTYFTHLAELVTLHNGFVWHQSFGFRESFYAQVIAFLFDYLSSVKVESSILEDFKESPYFIGGLTELVDEFKKVSFKNQDIINIEKNYKLLLHGFDKFLMENVISEKSKTNQKIKI